MTSDRQRVTLHDMLRQLSQALATALLYAPDHPRVVAGLPGLLDLLQQLLARDPELTLIVVNDDLLFQGKPLEKNPHTERVAKLLVAQGIGHIRFLPGLDAADLRLLIRCVCGQQSLDALQASHAKIRVGSVDIPDDPERDAATTAIESFEQLTSTQLGELQELYRGIGGEGPVDPRPLVSLVAGFVVAFRREANPLLAMVPLRKIDEYTFTHSINVGILNIAQGLALGIEGQLLHDLGVAGMLHDAGKIFVDREIIQKPGKLTDEEFAVIRSHPSRGAQYLMSQPGISPLAIISAYEHHMRFDLQGYPKPPEEWPLNLVSQMTMISDTFDALRTRRIYKDPWDFPKVSSHMLALAGSQLNGDLVINFLRLLGTLGESLPPQPADDTIPAKGCYCE